MEIPIIYEDNHLLVVNKPVNLLAGGQDRGQGLALHPQTGFKVRYNKPGNVYLGLVHRLDRPVGGVMILAKTSGGGAPVGAGAQPGTGKACWPWCTAGPKQRTAWCTTRSGRAHQHRRRGGPGRKEAVWNTGACVQPAASAWWRSTWSPAAPSGPRPVCRHRPSLWRPECGPPSTRRGSNWHCFAIKFPACTPPAGSI